MKKREKLAAPLIAVLLGLLVGMIIVIASGKSPVLLISEKLFDIIRYYDAEVEFRIAVLTDLKQKRQDVYRLMVPKVEDALSEQTIYFKNGFLDTPVLKRNLCPQRRIFYVTEGYTYQLIVTEDVLESILARNSIGILYEEIKTE